MMLATASTHAGLNFDKLKWEKDIERRNLSIYIADVPGSNIKAFRARSVYKTNLDQLVSAITDMDNFTSWVDGAVKANTLKKEGNAQWCYYENHVPFPYKNRDGVIVQRVVKINDKEIVIELSADNDIKPPLNGLVRITDLTGSWKLQSLAGKKVELTYQVHLDPTGVLPSWVVNLMLTNTPKATLLNLHKVDFSIYKKPSSLYSST